MPTIRDDCVCVRHWDWSETSQTVSLLGREQGMFRAVAKGARRERGPFSGGLEWLSRGEAVAIIKSGPGLATLTAWDLREPHAGLRHGLDRFYGGAYCAELVMATVLDADPHPRLYDALCRALGELADNGVPAGRAVLAFQWATAVESGWRPDLDLEDPPEEPEPGTRVHRFDPELGGLAPAREGQGWLVRDETVGLLRSLRGGRDGVAGAGWGGWQPEVVGRACRLLAAYLGHRIGRTATSWSGFLASGACGGRGE